MSARGAQLALKFPLSSRARLDTFLVGDNGELVRVLETLPEAEGFRGCFLYGPTGVGRTHLLQAVCHRAGEVSDRAASGAGGGAIYLPLADETLAPASLEGLDALSLVALDDVEAWLGDAEAEQALLGLYQGLQSRGGRLLVGAGASATHLEFRYADLSSRLRSLPTYEVRGLRDTDKARLLRRRAEERGLRLSPAVLDYWLARSSRDLPSLLDELERLDEAAMAAQRRVTVPLIKEVLGL